MNGGNKKIGEIATIVMGLSPSSKSYNREGVGLPLLNGPTEFGAFSPRCTLYTTDSKRECERGDLIFCVRGNTTGRMNWADIKYSLGRGVCSMRGETKMDTKYIKYCLEKFLPELLQMAGGSTMPNLNQAAIKQFPIPYPPYRNKITAILSAYDDLIENNLRRIKILEEMAQALYREWFVHFRFPSHEKVRFVDSPLGKIPEGWVLLSVKDLIETSIGGSWGKDEASINNTCKVRVVRGTDFKDLNVGFFDRVPTRYIKPTAFKRRKLQPGDIIVENSVNASSRCVGTPLVITEGLLRNLQYDTICASFCKMYRPKIAEYSVLLFLHMQYLLAEGKMEYYQNVAANGIGNFQSERFLYQECIPVPSDHHTLIVLLKRISPLLSTSFAEMVTVLRRTRDFLLPKLISVKLT